MVKLPDYNPRDYPLTETWLSIYDLATEWAEESGEPHRNTFRFACQYMETALQNKKLEEKVAEEKQKIAELKQEEKRLIEDIKDRLAQAVILKAIKDKKLFEG
jgi:hypothetical protein